MQVRVVDVGFSETQCHTRLPFKFGTTVLEQAPLLTATVAVQTVDGRQARGFAADLLVPKWFAKDSSKNAAEDQDELRSSARAAAEVYGDATLGARTAFDLWWHAYRERVGSQPTDAPDLLVRGFGVALLERAVLDGVCRAADKSFFAALHGDLFGFLPGEVHPELQGWDYRATLPPPLQSVQVRHTVGMLDPLRSEEIPQEQRVADGFPQALDEYVREQGLRWFKIKVGAGFEADRRRLLDLAALFDGLGQRPRFTLDGNEQFEEIQGVVELLRGVAADPRGATFLDGLQYVEQPLPRSATFDPAANRGMGALAALAPCILDEADLATDSFPRAIELGYTGISVKNCKGVFRALLNAGLCATRGKRLFQSAEDLTNLPVLALQQDLCTVAALGLPHVERNGHHYFPGLDHLPADLARAALEAYPDLYRPHGDGVALRIEGGALRLGSLQTPGYGHDLDGSM